MSSYNISLHENHHLSIPTWSPSTKDSKRFRIVDTSGLFYRLITVLVIGVLIASIPQSVAASHDRDDISAGNSPDPRFSTALPESMCDMQINFAELKSKVDSRLKDDLWKTYTLDCLKSFEEAHDLNVENCRQVGHAGQNTRLVFRSKVRSLLDECGANGFKKPAIVHRESDKMYSDSLLDVVRIPYANIYDALTGDLYSDTLSYHAIELKSARELMKLLFKEQKHLVEKKAIAPTIDSISRVLDRDYGFPSVYIAFAYPHFGFDEGIKEFLTNLKQHLMGVGFKTIYYSPEDSTPGTMIDKFQRKILTSDFVLLFGTESLKFKQGRGLVHNINAELQLIRERFSSGSCQQCIFPISFSIDKKVFPESYYGTINTWNPLQNSYLVFFQDLVANMLPSAKDQIQKITTQDPNTEFLQKLRITRAFYGSCLIPNKEELSETCRQLLDDPGHPKFEEILELRSELSDEKDRGVFDDILRIVINKATDLMAKKAVDQFFQTFGTTASSDIGIMAGRLISTIFA